MSSSFLARHFGDGFRMVTVREKRRMPAYAQVDEQAAWEPFCSGQPSCAAVLSMKTMNKDAELHDGGSTSFTLVVTSGSE